MSDQPTKYRELTEQFARQINQEEVVPEDELDTLLAGLKKGRMRGGPSGGRSYDPIDWLRDLTLTELVPTFVELVEKYSGVGISMQMDASNFLEGGREIKFEFGIDGHRLNMIGTVTTEAIAFHETRYSPHVDGELLSGPMLRLRGLTGASFRQFICERLTMLLREAVRRR